MDESKKDAISISTLVGMPITMVNQLSINEIIYSGEIRTLEFECLYRCLANLLPNLKEMLNTMNAPSEMFASEQVNDICNDFKSLVNDTVKWHHNNRRALNDLLIASLEICINFYIALIEPLLEYNAFASVTFFSTYRDCLGKILTHLEWINTLNEKRYYDTFVLYHDRKEQIERDKVIDPSRISKRLEFNYDRHYTNLTSIDIKEGPTKYQK